MCAPVIGVPGGNPVTLTTNVAVPLVMVPLASLVTSNVTVTVPVPVFSPPTTPPVSLDGSSAAVNVGFVGVVGEVDEELPHEAANNATPTIKTLKRFIGFCLLESDQKNLRLKLNPKYSASGLPPRAICA